MVDNERFRGAISHFEAQVQSIFPDRFGEVVEGLGESESRASILAHLERLMYSAPEIRARKAYEMYYSGGLREFLKGLGFDDEERRQLINALAGQDVAHSRDKVNLTT